MLHENEVLMFLLGLGVLIFILTNRVRLKSIPNSKILLSAFFVLCIAWIATITEHFFFEEIINYIEHVCYSVSAVLIAVWSWKVLGRKEETS